MHFIQVSFLPIKQSIDTGIEILSILRHFNQ
jgi:hypothetical protein